ncbi:MAG: glutathione synthetase [Actinomycetales bacterium]|nr:glutathione synthetase [Actinomycetales bacterium]
MSRPKVTLVTSSDLPTLSDDFSGLLDAISRRGVEVGTAVWDDPGVDWEGAGLCVILTVSDFADRPEEFFEWAARVPRLLNDPGVLRWNSDKHYLQDLALSGVPTIDTTWLEPGAGLSKHQVHTRMPARGDFVVKSSLSSNRHTTGRYTSTDARSRGAAIQHALDILGTGRAALVQRYLTAVGDRGEISLVYFNGLFSHAVEKEGILQTEVDPGSAPRSRAYPHEVSPEERHLGEDVRNAFHACIRKVTGRDHLLIYARVDIIHTADGLKVLEVNLMDVTLYLAAVPGAVDNFADAIAVRAFW